MSTLMLAKAYGVASILIRKMEEQPRLKAVAVKARDLASMLNRKRSLKADLDRAEHVIRALIERHYDGWSLAPRELRLHVGARDSLANFWAQGINSSHRVLEIFGPEPERPRLDWGCGSGRTLLWLRGYPGWRDKYHGCDVDSEAIEWLKAQGQANVTTCGDLPPLPYQDSFFGGIFAFSVLTHIRAERHREWYKELHRILIPHGRAYVTNHGASIAHQLHLPGRVSREFDRQGWAWLEVRGHYRSSSIVSEAFTRKSLEGLFDVERFEASGYQNHDAYLLRRLT